VSGVYVGGGEFRRSRPLGAGWESKGPAAPDPPTPHPPPPTGHPNAPKNALGPLRPPRLAPFFHHRRPAPTRCVLPSCIHGFFDTLLCLLVNMEDVDTRALLTKLPTKLKMFECKVLLGCKEKEWTELGSAVLSARGVC